MLPKFPFLRMLPIIMSMGFTMFRKRSSLLPLPSKSLSNPKSYNIFPISLNWWAIRAYRNSFTDTVREIEQTFSIVFHTSFKICIVSWIDFGRPESAFKSADFPIPSCPVSAGVTIDSFIWERKAASKPNQLRFVYPSKKERAICISSFIFVIDLEKSENHYQRLETWIK